MKCAILTTWLCFICSVAQILNANSCGLPAGGMSCSTQISSGSSPRRCTGWATWYSRESARREGTGGARGLMANGRPLDDGAMTCAIWLRGKPAGQHFRVTNLSNGKTIIVHWTDRGPGHRSRLRGTIIDLTPAAFRALGGELAAGRMRVIVARE
ncbi:MAG: septal ring lytic transglycosylase RlpA family protein [Candidatus Omnitrophota bacterium]